MNALEPAPPAANSDGRLELVLMSGHPDEVLPALSDLHKDPARFAALEHLLAEFGEQLPERQHGVLVRTLGSRG